MPDLSQSLAAIQKAQDWLLQADTSGVMFETAKETVSKVAQFVKVHAEIAESPHASLDDKIESKRKFDAGKAALLSVTTLFTRTNLNQLQSEVAQAVSQEPSPAHAAAAIAARTIVSLESSPDPEVRAAAIFAAAGTISITLSHASGFSGSTREEISLAIRDAISQFPDGRVVLNFLEDKRYENLTA
jgi:L-lactate utilization protein LutC